MDQTLSFFIASFSGLFAIMNPIAMTPFFITITKEADDETRREVALKSTLVAFIVVSIFVALGSYLFTFFGITIPGFKKVLIQIKDRNNNVIAANEKKTTLKNNKKIKYSDELIADYRNNELEVLSLILVDRDNMEKGDYKINVFIDGNFTSSSIVALK